MADDNDKDSSSEKENPTYVRKKNIIPGWDNEHLMLTGLGILTAITIYPYARQWVENVVNGMRQGQPGASPYQQQLPPNGGGIPQQQQQQQVLNPPETQSQSKVTVIDQPQQLNPLQQHEKALADQAAYAAAMEKENLTGSQSISMVPERNPREKSRYTYEAGSNVSAGF